MPKKATKKETRELTDQRIEVIMAAMLDGAYAPGAGARALSATHPLFKGLSVTRIEELAAQAGRIIRTMARTDPETAKDALARAFINWSRLRAKAEALGTEKGFAVAAQCDELILTYLGMKPATKVEVQNKFSGWSKEELEEYARSGQRPEHATAGMLRPN